MFPIWLSVDISAMWDSSFFSLLSPAARLHPPRLPLSSMLYFLLNFKHILENVWWAMSPVHTPMHLAFLLLMLGCPVGSFRVRLEDPGQQECWSRCAGHQFSVSLHPGRPLSGRHLETQFPGCKIVGGCSVLLWPCWWGLRRPRDPPPIHNMWFLSGRFLDLFLNLRNVS